MTARQAGGRRSGQGRRSADETRALVLDVTRRLFYWRGIRATGVDRVAAEAGIAPTTLYRLFTSKDDLATAYVEYNAEPYKAWLLDATRREVGTPEQRILALFDALTEQTRPEHCRGCPFLMTLAEYPEADHPARLAAIALKSWVRDRLHDLVGELAAENGAVADAATLADQLCLVMEGVYASVQALGHEGPARRAHTAAASLIAAATTPPPPVTDR